MYEFERSETAVYYEDYDIDDSELPPVVREFNRRISESEDPDIVLADLEFRGLITRNGYDIEIL
jgi:hypothetical protein